MKTIKVSREAVPKIVRILAESDIDCPNLFLRIRYVIADIKAKKLRGDFLLPYIEFQFREDEVNAIAAGIHKIQSRYKVKKVCHWGQKFLEQI